MGRHLVVSVERDDKAGVWVATSDDIPGLVSEAVTLDHLHARVMAVIPELLRDNHVATQSATIELVVAAKLPGGQ